LRADGGAHLTCPTSQRPANRCRHCQASSPIRGTSCTPSQAPRCMRSMHCTKRTRCTWRHFYAVLHIWEANGTCLVHKAKARQASPEKDRNPRQHEYHSVWQSSLCESSRLGGAKEEGLHSHRSARRTAAQRGSALRTIPKNESSSKPVVSSASTWLQRNLQAPPGPSTLAAHMQLTTSSLSSINGSILT
jgi:hypothetical protein